MLETKGWNVPKRDAFKMTVDMKCPQQSDDSVDCGLFVMMYAKDLIEKKDWSYEQDTIAPFRRIVANWIFAKAGLK
jgi:Ulp1 family protease